MVSVDAAAPGPLSGELAIDSNDMDEGQDRFEFGVAAQVGVIYADNDNTTDNTTSTNNGFSYVTVSAVVRRRRPIRPCRCDGDELGRLGVHRSDAGPLLRRVGHLAAGDMRATRRTKSSAARPRVSSPVRRPTAAPPPTSASPRTTIKMRIRCGRNSPSCRCPLLPGGRPDDGTLTVRLTDLSRQLGLRRRGPPGTGVPARGGSDSAGRSGRCGRSGGVDRVRAKASSLARRSTWATADDRPARLPIRVILPLSIGSVGRDRKRFHHRSAFDDPRRLAG